MITFIHLGPRPTCVADRRLQRGRVGGLVEPTWPLFPGVRLLAQCYCFDWSLPRVCARAHLCRSSMTSSPTHAALLEPRSGVSPGRFWSPQTQWAGRETRASRFGEPRCALYLRCQQQSPSGSSQGAFLVIWRRFTEEIIRTMWASCSPRDACCSPQYAQVLSFFFFKFKMDYHCGGLQKWDLYWAQGWLDGWAGKEGRWLSPRGSCNRCMAKKSCTTTGWIPEYTTRRPDRRWVSPSCLLFKPLTLTLWGLYFNILVKVVSFAVENKQANNFGDFSQAV